MRLRHGAIFGQFAVPGQNGSPEAAILILSTAVAMRRT